MDFVMFLPTRAVVDGQCVAACAAWVDVAWVALYGFAWVGLAATIGWVWKRSR